MSNEPGHMDDTAAHAVVMKSLGIERGIIMGTDKDGATRTFFMEPQLADLAVYTKIIDNQIQKTLDHTYKGGINDTRDSRTTGVGEGSSLGDTGEEAPVS